MEIIQKKISRLSLKEKFNSYFKSVIKAVVDVRKEIIALDGELHADLEELLLKNGSKQEDLWGINLYPEESKENFIEYSALINIKPSQDNPSMEILNSDIKDKVKKVVSELIDYES